MNYQQSNLHSFYPCDLQLPSTTFGPNEGFHNMNTQKLVKYAQLKAVVRCHNPYQLPTHTPHCIVLAAKTKKLFYCFCPP